MPVTINGDGSITGLAAGGLPSSALTGALPAISGANLTGIPASNITATNMPAGTVVQTVFKNGTASGSSVQLNSGSMGNPAWFDTGGAGSSLAAITPIFANSKILVNFMFSLRMSDGNRLGVMAYVANNANMTNLARISDYRGSTGNESYRNATGGTDWHSHALFAVDDGSYTGSGGQIPMSTSERFYNIGYYNASGDGSNYYGDHSQRVYLILQEIKQ